MSPRERWMLAGLALLRDAALLAAIVASLLSVLDLWRFQ